MSWEVVLGLEIHAQLSTNSKIFSGAPTAYGAAPNTQVSAVDMALPGVLPVFNKAALKKAVQFGLAIGAEIGKKSVFDRKNYFYPDLPKGYQTSQMHYPIVGKGGIDIELEDGSIKHIGITRAHLEEDAGKSIHDLFTHETGIDLNRAGTPLLEIVSEPDMRSAKEAVAYMRKIHSLVQYLGVCDGNMQEGSFRCDVNVSLRRFGGELGTRTELKNLNSFRFVERAIATEVARQREILEAGGHIVQETRLYDAERDQTRSMRSKEDANDYRYFPCPDLLPIVIDDAYIEAVKAALPELPEIKKQRYINDLGLSAYDAGLISANKASADYFEQLLAYNADAKLAANWLNGEVAAYLNRQNLDIGSLSVSAQQLAQLLDKLRDKTLSGNMAKTVFEALLNQEGEVDAIIQARGLQQISDTGALKTAIDAVIAANSQQVANYRAAPADKQSKMIGFFVGQVMKATKGQADPSVVNQLLAESLQNGE